MEQVKRWEGMKSMGRGADKDCHCIIIIITTINYYYHAHLVLRAHHIDNHHILVGVRGCIDCTKDLSHTQKLETSHAIMHNCAQPLTKPKIPKIDIINCSRQSPRRLKKTFLRGGIKVVRYTCLYICMIHSIASMP